MFLAGDVGGTKTILALFDPQKNCIKDDSVKRYPCCEYDSLEHILDAYIKEQNEAISHVCLGVAGPVQRQHCTFTNLDWSFSSETILKKLNVTSVNLLNDLQAKVYALDVLPSTAVSILRKGERESQGNVVIVAPGTGLGVAYGVRSEQGLIASASEGGHIDFAPVDETEKKLLDFFTSKRARISYEYVCSGIGLQHIHEYLTVENQDSSPVGEKLKSVPEIIQQASEGDPISLQTVEHFVNILASFSANIALTFMPSGGLYLAGGLASRLKTRIMTEQFLTRYDNKGRLSAVLQSLPVSLIDCHEMALLGCIEWLKLSNRQY